MSPAQPFKQDGGFSLIETMAAVALVGIGLVAVLPLLTVATRGNTLDRVRVGAANSARQKIEALRIMPYHEIGVGNPGFHEKDYKNKPGYNAATDRYFVETVDLGLLVIGVRRTVVTGVDDASDLLGNADADKKVVDYKRITVTVEFTHNNRLQKVTQETILSGEGENTPPAPGP